MKRAHALQYMRIAGYHGNKGEFTRLLIEARVSLPVAQEQFREGARAKVAGAACNCVDCKTEGSR